jgi:hypothetical protein
MTSGDVQVGDTVVPKGGRRPYRFFTGTVRRGRREVSVVVYTNSWKALAGTLRTTVFDARQNWDEDYAGEADVAGGAVAAETPGASSWRSISGGWSTGRMRPSWRLRARR